MSQGQQGYSYITIHSTRLCKCLSTLDIRLIATISLTSMAVLDFHYHINTLPQHRQGLIHLGTKAAVHTKRVASVLRGLRQCYKVCL